MPVQRWRTAPFSIRRVFQYIRKGRAAEALEAEAPQAFPPGHYYSPIPSLAETQKREKWIFNRPISIPAIDLNESGQRETLAALAVHFPLIELSQEKRDGARFFWNNPNFMLGEAIIYAAMLRHVQPRRVIEVGSGYTTLLLLDTLDQMQSWETKVTCIEPYPELLKSLLSCEDVTRVRVHGCSAQDADPTWFDALEAGDILFVDSTHVCKAGSDVNFILFEILPRLDSGVHVHFHDVYYPFEYPKDWVLGGRNWNEAYLLRAFLQYNTEFTITCFNSYLGQIHPEWFQDTYPMFLRRPSSSLWLKKA